jgi:hypothetical protein
MTDRAMVIAVMATPASPKATRGIADSYVLGAVRSAAAVPISDILLIIFNDLFTCISFSDFGCTVIQYYNTMSSASAFLNYFFRPSPPGGSRPGTEKESEAPGSWRLSALCSYSLQATRSEPDDRRDNAVVTGFISAATLIARHHAVAIMTSKS